MVKDSGQDNDQDNDQASGQASGQADGQGDLHQHCLHIASYRTPWFTRF